MSAFYCGATHFSALVNAYHDVSDGYGRRLDQFISDAIRPAFPGETQSEQMFRTLAAANIASLASLYPSNWRELVSVGEYDSTVRFGRVTNPQAYRMAILKGADCYEYQSCEDSGWQASKACAFNRWLVAQAYATLPGYQEADAWPLSPESAATIDLLTERGRQLRGLGR